MDEKKTGVGSGRKCRYPSVSDSRSRLFLAVLGWAILLPGLVWSRPTFASSADAGAPREKLNAPAPLIVSSAIPVLHADPAELISTLQSSLPQGALPPQTRLEPLSHSSYIFVTSSPEGIAIARQLIQQLDMTPLHILVRILKVVVQPRLEDTSEPALPDILPASKNFAGGAIIVVPTQTKDGQRHEICINVLNAGLPSALASIHRSSRCRVVDSLGTILRDGVANTVTIDALQLGQEVPGKRKGLVSRPAWHVDTMARANWDGTITLYASIQDPGQSTALPTGAAIPSPEAVPLPGVRIENGKVLALLVQPSPTAATTGASATTSHPDSTHPELHIQRPTLIYFFAVDLVDEAGEVIPGGPEAVKKALGEQSRQRLPE